MAMLTIVTSDDVTQVFRVDKHSVADLPERLHESRFIQFRSGNKDHIFNRAHIIRVDIED